MLDNVWSPASSIQVALHFRGILRMMVNQCDGGTENELWSNGEVLIFPARCHYCLMGLASIAAPLEYM